MTLKSNERLSKRGPRVRRPPKTHSGSLSGQNHFITIRRRYLAFHSGICSAGKNTTVGRTVGPSACLDQGRDTQFYCLSLCLPSPGTCRKKWISLRMSLTEQHLLIWWSLDHWVCNFLIFCARKRKGHIQVFSADPSPAAAGRKSPATTELT